MLRIWKADKGQALVFPILLELLRPLGSNHDNFGVTFHELRIVPAQLRQMSLAKWSEETAVEDQDHIFLAPKIGQADHFSVEIGERKIGGGSI